MISEIYIVKICKQQKVSLLISITICLATMSMSMWSLRGHFTNKSVTGASYSIKVIAGHYGEQYDDWQEI